MVSMVKFGCKQGAQKCDNMAAILLEETQVCSSNVLAALCGAKLPSTFMTFKGHSPKLFQNFRLYFYLIHCISVSYSFEKYNVCALSSMSVLIVHGLEN